MGCAMRARAGIDQLYSQQIKPLPARDRLQLLALIAEDLAIAIGAQGPQERSLLELEGLGAALWDGVDAQAFVDALRNEWERRP